LDDGRHFDRGEVDGWHPRGDDLAVSSVYELSEAFERQMP
jgi:hypothetical protein